MMCLWHNCGKFAEEKEMDPSILGGSTSPLNVEDEYNANLRTQSYLDLYTMVHPNRTRGQCQNQNNNQNQDHNPSPSPSQNIHLSPIASGFFRNLPHSVLNPSQETLNGLKLSSILVEFFQTTMEACAACSVLLASLDKARRHHKHIRRLLLRLSEVAAGQLNNGPGQAVFAELERRVEVDNPLSSQNLSLFHNAHSRYHPLVFRLASAHRRKLCQARFIRVVKKVSILIIFKCIAKKIQRNERAEVQMDMAVKGAYIVERDFDTISRMVQRAYDEIEHGRDVVKMVLEERKRQLVREVAREVVEGEEELMEQLEELEEHVYLCMITINRSRRLVAQEIVGEDPR
ncbi:transmembrane protein (DUF677) [Rhynchospora pubera]|uniref:Transmembrane protein (DUF677) n=1 Tax=Rhynchospora pubera TaxID=906938 RepID=A0AAV8EBR2_9POAL|nr:transmembrane protein (DUF677) [Rhynchospora pubera]